MIDESRSWRFGIGDLGKAEVIDGRCSFEPQIKADKSKSRIRAFQLVLSFEVISQIQGIASRLTALRNDAIGVL